MPYNGRFRSDGEVSSYEDGEYAPGSYASFIWALQRPFLEKYLLHQKSTVPSVRLLDFACGTGRVLSFVEDLVDESVGLDISPEMVRIAAGKCRRSTFYIGNIIDDPQIVVGKYEVITLFRFLLNAEPDLRLAILRWLRSRMNEQHGFLIANMHGNAWSLRHSALSFHKWRKRSTSSGEEGSDQLLSEMTPRDVYNLFRTSGFEIVEQIGFGLLPQVVFRTPLRYFSRWLDRTFAGAPLLKNVSIDLLFLCKPI